MKAEQIIRVLIEDLKDIYARHLELLDLVSPPSLDSVGNYAQLKNDVERKLRMYEAIDDINNIDLDDLLNR